ncbi:MAG: DUF3014 domain-containing protein [Colwellia sp.]|nr:DUF3014 domain-containing protein [Colwellia sp.]
MSDKVPPPKATVKEIVQQPVLKEVITKPEVIVIDTQDLEEITEPAIELVETNPLPTLDNSDEWLREKLPSLTWRKELLKLVIDDDMIRRLVVFTDNFSQGILAYNYSPLVSPNIAFSALETQMFDENNQQQWEWDVQLEKRFSLYIELLRSIESDSLVKWYLEVKPLVDQAYVELGYPDDDFTYTLQSAITRILDAEMPKAPLKVIRPSVMYKYQDAEIEALDDVDKLLLRIGKENVLIIKSILLEFSEKLDEKTSP